MTLNVLRLLKTFQTCLEKHIERGMHVGDVHRVFNKGAKASTYLDLDHVRLFVFQLLDQVSDQVVLQLE